MGDAGFAAAFGWSGPNNYSTAEWLGGWVRTTPTIVRCVGPWPTNSATSSGTVGLEYGRGFDDAIAFPSRDSTPECGLSDTRSVSSTVGEGEEAITIPISRPSRPQVRLPKRRRCSTVPRWNFAADAFHPGCEMAWPMRHHTLYMAPFRIAHAVKAISSRNTAVLDMDVMAGLLPYGPLRQQVPGGVTRWMAVPWQTDTASCRSGYVKKYIHACPLSGSASSEPGAGRKLHRDGRRQRRWPSGWRHSRNVQTGMRPSIPGQLSPRRSIT